MAITWNSTIKGQFRPIDIEHMKQVTGGDLDLSDYASTKSHGDDVYDMVKSKRMPPRAPWSDTYVQNFKEWMDAGYPEN